MDLCKSVRELAEKNAESPFGRMLMDLADAYCPAEERDAPAEIAAGDERGDSRADADGLSADPPSFDFGEEQKAVQE